MNWWLNIRKNVWLSRPEVLKISKVLIGQNFESKTWYIQIFFGVNSKEGTSIYVEDGISNELAAQIIAQKLMGDIEAFVLEDINNIQSN